MKPQFTDEQAQELWDDLGKRYFGDTLYEKIQNALCDIHTSRKCATCDYYCRPRYLRGGKCPSCVALELAELKGARAVS